MEIMADHVHMLISFSPKSAPAQVIKAIKGSNARQFFLLHPKIKVQKMWGGYFWSSSYFISTLGNMSKDIIENYIQNQYNK